jgi:hypothetical protein
VGRLRRKSAYLGGAGEPNFRELEPDLRMAEVAPAPEGRRVTTGFRIDRLCRLRNNRCPSGQL